MVHDFQINLANPEEIREKMPEIKALLADARQEHRALGAQIELLARIVGERPSAAQGGSKSASRRKAAKSQSNGAAKSAPSQERAMSALEKAGRPMGPAELFRFMGEHGLQQPSSVNALNALLWTAAKAGRAVRTEDGYALPAWLAAAAPAQLPDSNGHGSALQAFPNGDSRDGEDREQG